MKVNVHPNISATDALAEQMGDADSRPIPAERRAGAAKETLVQAFVGAADSRADRLDRQGRGGGGTGRPGHRAGPAGSGRSTKGSIRTRANLAYDITRADVTQLVVEVPADHNVVNVFDPNVQKWEKKTEGPLQTLTITLFQPTRGTQNMLIELEKFAGDKEMPQEMMNAEIEGPGGPGHASRPPEAMTNVGRQQGVVVGAAGHGAAGRSHLADGPVADR